MDEEIAYFDGKTVFRLRIASVLRFWFFFPLSSSRFLHVPLMIWSLFRSSIHFSERSDCHLTREPPDMAVRFIPDTESSDWCMSAT